ncbi:MAG: hypothetical protein JWM82_860, partial [Myxococcales bacterium]|nr:hypothetical protein [Myxococcales bacterium]
AGLRVRPLAAAAAHRTLALVWRPGAPGGVALRQVGGVVREGFRALKS